MPSSSEIKEALKNLYCQPEWILGFEVPNATGSLSKRRADAVAMNLFPSKNYEIRGFEIKISKSDLKKDLEDGSKSNEVAKYCDYWFLATPKGLTNNFTLPATWGVIEFDGEKLRQKVKPQRIEKAPMTASFAAALLQTQARLFDQEMSSTINTRVQEAIKSTLESEKRDWDYNHKDMQQHYRVLVNRLQKIKVETGLDLMSVWFSEKQMMSVIAAIKCDEASERLFGVQRIAEQMRKAADLIEGIEYSLSIANGKTRKE